MELVHSFFDEVVYVGDGELNSRYVDKSYTAEFRTLNPINISKNYKKLKKLIHLEKPDVVHSQQVTRLAYFTSLIMKKTSTPYVVTAWGSDVLVVPNQSAIKKFIVQKTLSRANAVTADSSEMTDVIKKLCNCTNVQEVLFGIDPIAPGTKEKIVYSNRQLKPLYNIDQVIDEYNYFQKSHPDWKLIIAADGPEKTSLRSKVEQLGITDKVEFVGWLDSEQNKKYYQKATIFISIPKRDGTAVSLLEAMSAGCLPVVADLNVSHEWIEDEVNGIIKKDKEEGALNRALNIDFEKAQQINRDIIFSKATKQVASEKYKNIYRQLKVIS